MQSITLIEMVIDNLTLNMHIYLLQYHFHIAL